MNDPGSIKLVKDAEKEVRHGDLDGESNLARLDRERKADLEKEKKAIQRQQADYKDPSLWWFASTGCPLIAGAFGPLANAFSVCALVRGWRTYIPVGENEATGTKIPDPIWLLAINGLSLACGAVANIALLLNMSRRLRFKIAQPISVSGFLLAGLLLIADTAAFAASPTYHLPFNSPAAPKGRHALTPAFYYAIQAAIIYIVISGLMCLTVWGYWKGHYKDGFRLTLAQRTLMLQTMAFVTYLLVGAVIYSSVEGWEFLDALYWADLTLLTIGLGSDFAPATHTGRVLLFFYAIGGIIIIGLVISSIRTLILDRGKTKLSARMMEKKRLRAIRSIDPVSQEINVSRFTTMTFDNRSLDVNQRRELEFEVMRKVQDHADRDRKWLALAFSTSAAFGLWFIGALVFYKSEAPQKWSYFDAMYFAYTCLTTIGYGDSYPKSNSGKAFFVFWTLLAVPTLTILISDMSDTVVATFRDLTIWFGTLTVLPGEEGFRAQIKHVMRHTFKHKFKADDFKRRFMPAGILGEIPESNEAAENMDNAEENEEEEYDHVTERLALHIEKDESLYAAEADKIDHHVRNTRDLHFYHVVLARELRSLMRDLFSSPAKKYTWREWEYYLKLMDNVDPETQSDQHLVPKALRTTSMISKFKLQPKKEVWTWLGSDSPLMSYKSETEWILERIGKTLEREVQMSRKVAAGLIKERPRPPPVSLSEMIQRGVLDKLRGDNSQYGWLPDDDDIDVL